MSETVVVVGATGEMGRLISRDLMTQGYRVVGVARSAQALEALRQDLPELVPCVADIASDDAIGAIQDCLVGTVRAVVHGPGVPTAGGIASAPTSALLEATNIKVGGFVRLVRACDANVVPGSRLIAIGGHYGFEPTAYAATAGVGNAALANVVRQYSWAMGERGITAHLVAPGPADTPRLRRVAATRAEQESVEPDVVLDRMRAESALGEFTEIESVSWAIGVLLDRRANALAGSTLFMDAGRRRGLP